MKTTRASGFTLIEMMIAMTIMAFIGVALYEGTTSTFALRDNIEKEGDFYNSIRVALDVIGRDIAHIYSPKAAAMPGEVGKVPAEGENVPGQGRPNTGGNPQYETSGEPTNFWGAPVNSFGLRPSRLQGEEGKISFVINSHIRLFRNVKESDFAKITYELEEAKVGQRLSGARKLVKREDPAAFVEQEDPETAATYTLLTNVKKLEFKFLDGEKDNWENRWDTAGMDHQDKFPDVIEVTLEVFYPDSDNTLSVTQRYRPEQLYDL